MESEKAHERVSIISDLLHVHLVHGAISKMEYLVLFYFMQIELDAETAK